VLDDSPPYSGPSPQRIPARPRTHERHVKQSQKRTNRAAFIEASMSSTPASTCG